ncbi:MAG: serine/threonine-protein kinase, partial [Acidobacteriota bacterium]
MSADRDRRPEPSDATSPAQLGGYRVIRLLGAGGMGQVYLAHDDVLDRPVAIKRLRPDGATRPDRRARFRREARLAARLNHPAVVQLYGVLDGDDGDGLVMEFVAGASLRAYADGRALPIDEVLDIGLQLADGLGYAHDQGIVHRDLKGENVLRTPDGRLKIADFGIAKALAGDAATRSDQTSLTRGNVLGTYRAMAPEQARGDAIDHRADLFAFGVLLYELLAGHNPFLADNDLATLRRVIEAAHAPLRDHRPDVPDGLAALVDHLLQKDPRLRPRHAAEVAEALRQLRGLPAPAPPSALTRPPAAALRAGAVTSATFAPVATHEAPATVD